MKCTDNITLFTALFFVSSLSHRSHLLTDLGGRWLIRRSSEARDGQSISIITSGLRHCEWPISRFRVVPFQTPTNNKREHRHSYQTVTGYCVRRIQRRRYFRSSTPSGGKFCISAIIRKRQTLNNLSTARHTEPLQIEH